jgi:purine-nucleoside phosphorylase
VKRDISACLDETARAVQGAVSQLPSIGVVLGTGLGGFVDRMRNVVSLPFAKVPHMAVPRTRLNEGNLCFGVIDDVSVVCLQGRAHLYEGYPAWQVVHGVRLMARLGVRAVLLTDVCRALESTWTRGTMMVIRDHLDFGFGAEASSLPESDGLFRPPLELTIPYDDVLSEELHDVARSETLLAARIGKPIDIVLQEGVYAGLRDPSGLTRAQIRMFSALGADAIGMGIVPEAVALMAMGIRVGALGYVHHVAAPSTTLPDDEATGRGGHALFDRVLRAWVLRAART